MVIRTMTQKDSREVAALSEQLGYSSSEADNEEPRGKTTGYQKRLS